MRRRTRPKAKIYSVSLSVSINLSRDVVVSATSAQEARRFAVNRYEAKYEDLMGWGVSCIGGIIPFTVVLNCREIRAKKKI